jgi:hypothetical protein
MLYKHIVLFAVGVVVPLLGPNFYCTAQEHHYLDQGWSEAQRQDWYTMSQGSRLLPRAWFMALELAGSSEKFAAPLNMRRYGYLVNYAAGDELPIGFVTDQGSSPDHSSEPWVGMTCAACHTGDVTYKGQRVRIDGAPTLADYESFIEDFAEALSATVEKSEKFDKFAAEVLGAELAAKKSQLKTDLQKQAEWYSKVVKKSHSSVKYGRGRLDAQGHILNKASLIVGVPTQLDGYPADAPASYPFLWNTPQQERVQWNGIAVFNDIFPLFRNIGQFVGVFGSLDIESHVNDYPTSLRLDNMIRLEDLMKKLQSPLWPEQMLPKIGLIESGKALFQQNCASCHTSIDRATGEPVEIAQAIAQMKSLADVRTDLWLACNVYIHQSRTGVLGPPLKPIDNTTAILTNIILGVDRNLNPPSSPTSSEAIQRTDWTYSSKNSSESPLSKAEREEKCKKDQDIDDRLGYKAGPLNGIWATAPYLHNGSVPTLADLLLPPAQRPMVFTVGGIEFDPERVGFKSGPGDGPFEFHVRDGAGTVIPGNDNAGHEYSTQLSAQDRAALLEYLKAL